MARDERLGRGARAGQPARPAAEGTAEAVTREGGGRTLVATCAALAVAAAVYLLVGRTPDRAVHTPDYAEPAGAASTDGGSVGESPAGRPVLTRVDVTPQMPHRTEDVTAVVEAQDAEGDPVTYAYEWLVNGEPVGATGERLSLGTFAPGDRVAVRVTASDSGGPGAARVSTPAIIANRAPELTRVDIAPTPPKPGEPLRLEIEATDPDDDPVTYGIEWLVNDAIIAGATEPVLDGARVVSGARIVAVVTPQDPYEAGPKRTSAFVQVGNRAPEITSTPPAGLTGDLFRYQIVAADPDGDPLSYHLEQGPAGMTVDPKTGAVEWAPTPLPGDSASIALRAEDGKGGRAVQRFTVKTQRPS